MPIRDTGFGQLLKLENGKWVPIEPENFRMSFSVEGMKLFDYDQETGVLRVRESCLPSGALEQIMGQIEKREEVYLSIPLHPKPVHLKGIKTARYFTPRELVTKEETYEPTETKERKTLLQRLKGYLSGH